MIKKRFSGIVFMFIVILSLVSGVENPGNQGFIKGNVYSGFTLVQKEFIPEINATALIFQHVKSGARLIKLENEDSDNVFSIVFRTLPQNDTGVAHIMEHSVLCGSERFPVKSPFDIMRKGSLRTFLNAMTGSDRTMYPIASRNKKDFYNLMTVYLDGVFHPALLKDERILRQEGWRYEYDPETETLQYNGIVFNEMKGAMSSPDRALNYAVFKTLLPDTVYARNSGGDPRAIPGLTQEQFVSFHSKFYHPSNAYIYLYGDLDTAEQLAFINGEYLSAFEKRTMGEETGKQEPFAERKSAVCPYPAGKGDDSHRDYLSVHFVMNNITTPEEAMALSVLEEYLMGSTASPLKKALEEKGFGTLVYGSLSRANPQIMSFVAVGADRERQSEFTDTVVDVLNRVEEKGLDPSLLDSILNRMEFRLREPASGRLPRGLSLMFQATASWISFGNPLDGLAFEEKLEHLRTDKAIWKRILRDQFVNNSHAASITMVPDPMMTEALRKEEREKLENIRKSLSEADLAQIMRMNSELKAYQETPDSPEALATVPLLNLSDIQPDIKVPQGETINISRRPLMIYTDNTNGIFYWELYFDISDLNKEELQKAVLLSQLLGQLGAGPYNDEKLSMKVNSHLGGLSFDVSRITDEQDPSLWKVYAVVSLRALSREAEEAVKLLTLVLTSTDFRDEQRLGTLLGNENARMERKLVNEGLDLSISRANSAMGGPHVFDEVTSGYEYNLFIHEMERDFRKDPASVRKELKQTYETIFAANRVTSGLVTDEELLERGVASTEKILSSLPVFRQGATAPSQSPRLDGITLREGFASPSRVNFVAQVADLNKEGAPYNGSILAASTIVRNVYLWQSLRVRGGAYGGGMWVYPDRTMLMYSFRDPYIKETLQVFEEAGDFLARFEPSKKEMELYLIGTMANLDLSSAPLSRGRYYFNKVLSGGDLQEINRIRKEVLSTTPEMIRSYAPLFRKMTGQGIYSVYGNEKQIRDVEGETFSKVIQVD